MTEGDQMTSTQTHYGLLKSTQWIIESHLLLFQCQLTTLRSST